MESCSSTHTFSGMPELTLAYNNENNHNNIAIIIIIYNLAQHLLSVIRAFEVQVPENIVNKMQYLLVE